MVSGSSCSGHPMRIQKGRPSARQGDWQSRRGWQRMVGISHFLFVIQKKAIRLAVLLLRGARVRRSGESPSSAGLYGQWNRSQVLLSESTQTLPTSLTGAVFQCLLLLYRIARKCPYCPSCPDRRLSWELTLMSLCQCPSLPLSEAKT